MKDKEVTGSWVLGWFSVGIVVGIIMLFGVL